MNERIKPETWENDFRACGHVPRNPENTDFTKCIERKNSVAIPADFNKNWEDIEKKKLITFETIAL